MTTSPIPNVRDDDPEDVSWALSTAATSYARGDRVEALKWLRRAADAASEADKDQRALELAKAAAELSNPPPQGLTPQMPAMLIPGPPPSRPPPSRPPPSRPSRPTPIGAPTAPPSKPTLANSADASSPFPLLVPPAPETKPGLAPAPTKRASSRSTPIKSKPEPRPRVPSTNDERTETLIVTEVTRLDAKPAGASLEADAWPTESMAAEDLDSLNEVYGQERTRIGSPAYQPEEPQKPQKPQKVAFRASQAVHVVIWRDPDGTLRVAPKGTSVSAVTIEALLVAPGPDVDLLAWLTPD